MRDQTMLSETLLSDASEVAGDNVKHLLFARLSPLLLLKVLPAAAFAPFSETDFREGNNACSGGDGGGGRGGGDGDRGGGEGGGGGGSGGGEGTAGVCAFETRVWCDIRQRQRRRKLRDSQRASDDDDDDEKEEGFGSEEGGEETETETEDDSDTDEEYGKDGDTGETGETGKTAGADKEDGNEREEEGGGAVVAISRLMRRRVRARRDVLRSLLHRMVRQNEMTRRDDKKR